MKPIARIHSHLAAAGIGIAIAAAGGGFSRQPAPLDPSVATRRHSAGTAATGTGTAVFKKSDRPTKEVLTTQDFQQAWDGMVSRRLARDERIPIQRKLLEAWAQVDLRGAMDAAMKEAWGGGDHFLGTSVFSQVFADRPLDAWRLIQSGRYGVGAQSLRDRWVESVMKNNRLLVASMLSEFSSSMGKRVIQQLLFGQTGQERDAIMGKIIAQAGDSHDEWLQEAFMALPGGGDPAALRERWSTLPTGQERKVGIMQWCASVKGLRAERLAAELSLVPTEAKSEVTKALFSQMNIVSPGLPAAVEFAISTDEWKTVAESAAQLLSVFSEVAHTADPVKLAEWGVNLPAGPDTVKIYQTAIGRYIRDDLARARQWLEAMPEGSWQREHGLSEFFRQARGRNLDLASSQWALDSITDPSVKAETTKWEQDWQEKHFGGAR